MDGIVCCNMSNPVGAARAITEEKSSAVIVGMDHDEEALRYLNEGIIYCLGVQDCYSIGFDTIQTAVKIADGNKAGDLFPEKTDEITTVIYQDDAAMVLATILLLEFSRLSKEKLEEEKETSRNFRNMANTDSMTGVKNKLAYSEEEAAINNRIESGDFQKLAVVVGDINGLNGRVEENIKENAVVIAIGYSALEHEDQHLSDVFERADRMMYERKKELKAMGTPDGR